MSKKIVLACLFLGLLSACDTAPKKDNDSSATVEDRSASARAGDPRYGDDGGGATTFGADSDRLGDIDELDDPQNILSTRTIYFDYDSSEIQAVFREVVEAHSNYLLEHPERTVVLEGHADERGSREYNLALGERRAQAVKRQMSLLGVPGSQIRTTSYGEERPVVDGHDEDAWSQNRRVEIIY